jgi:putative flippase GtrA
MIGSSAIGTPAQRALVASFLRFGVVGASGFLVDTAVVYATKGALGLNGAGIPAYIAAATWTWAFNRWWTFRGQGSGPMWRQWLRFLGANMMGFVLNRGAYFLLIAFSQTCRDYPVIAVGAGAVAGMFANFVASRRLVFR